MLDFIVVQVFCTFLYTIIENAIEYTSYKGIPVIDCKKFYSDSDEELQQLKEFAKKGMEYRDENSLILDFRGNAGGSSMYIYDFLKGLLGQEIGYNAKYLQHCSKLYIDYLAMLKIDWIPENPDVYVEDFCPKISNKKRIYVLIDEKSYLYA